MKILFFGDIIAKLGRQAIKQVIDQYKKEYDPDLIMANCENLSHGVGITQSAIQEMMDAGIQFFTSGNHIFRRKESIYLLENSDTNILRPANFPKGSPGIGMKVIEVGTKKLAVINLIGQAFFKVHYDNPFLVFDELYAQLKQEYGKQMPAIFVDFHAEATAEKRAFFLYADGKVSAVVGTHTHVPTADTYVTEHGTALCTDVGMVGGKDTVIGVLKDVIIYNSIHQVLHQGHEFPESGLVQVNAVLIDITGKTGKAKSITRVDTEVMI